MKTKEKLFFVHCTENGCFKGRKTTFLKGKFLFHVAFGIGDGGPAAEVVLEDVVAICEACCHACLFLMLQS